VKASKIRPQIISIITRTKYTVGLQFHVCMQKANNNNELVVHAVSTVFQQYICMSGVCMFQNLLGGKRLCEQMLTN